MSARIQQAFHAAQQQRDHEAGLALESILNDTLSIEQLQIDMESEVAMYETLSETMESLEANPALESVFEVPANHYIETYSLEADGALAKLKEVGSAVWEKIKEIFAKIKAFFKALFAKIMEFFQQMKFEVLAWWKPAMQVDMDVSSETIDYLRGALKGSMLDLKPAINVTQFDQHLKKLENVSVAALKLANLSGGQGSTDISYKHAAAQLGKQWEACTVQIGPWSINRSFAFDDRSSSGQVHPEASTIPQFTHGLHQTVVSEVHNHPKPIHLKMRLDDVKAMQQELSGSSKVTKPMNRIMSELDHYEKYLNFAASSRQKDEANARSVLQLSQMVAKISHCLAGDIQKYAQVVQKGYDVYKVAVRNAKRDMRTADNDTIQGEFADRLAKPAAA
jgi:phosphoribosylformylglycinamidine (FGAM) synthase PurS component